MYEREKVGISWEMLSCFLLALTIHLFSDGSGDSIGSRCSDVSGDLDGSEYLDSFMDSDSGDSDSYGDSVSSGDSDSSDQRDVDLSDQEMLMKTTRELNKFV